MKYLTILLLLLFPLGQLVRWTIPGTEIVLHPNDFAVAVVVSFWLLKRRKISGPLVKPLVFFAGAILISLLYNSRDFSLYELGTAALYPLRFFTYAGLYFVFKDLSLESKKLVGRYLLFVTVIIAVTGLLQYLLLPDVSFLKVLDWDDHYFRLIGTFLDPGFTGAILVLGLVLAYFYQKMAIVPIYVALALTYSRASYLMYLVSFAVAAYLKRNVRIFLIATLVLAVTIPLLPRTFGEGTKLSRENSIEARIQNWERSLGIWQKNPIFGVGFNTYRYVVGVSPQSHSGGADSSIFLVLATTGVVGLTAYFYLLWRMWTLGNILFRVSLLGVLIHSFFNNTLFYPQVLEWLWIILALR